MNPIALKLYIMATAFDWFIWGGAIALGAYSFVTLYRLNQFLKRKGAK